MKIKINKFDVIAIVLLLALALVAYFKFNVIEHTKTDTKMDKIEYVMEFKALRQYSVDTFKSGDTLYDSQTKMEIGTIKDISVKQCITYAETIKGTVVPAPTEDKYDVTITVETEGMETDKAYFANRSVELKVGTSKKVETLYIKSTGEIQSINVIKEKEA
jgi:hypothetical protein